MTAVPALGLLPTAREERVFGGRPQVLAGCERGGLGRSKRLVALRGAHLWLTFDVPSPLVQAGARWCLLELRVPLVLAHNWLQLLCAVCASCTTRARTRAAGRDLLCVSGGAASPGRGRRGDTEAES